MKWPSFWHQERRISQENKGSMGVQKMFIAQLLSTVFRSYLREILSHRKNKVIFGIYVKKHTFWCVLERPSFKNNRVMDVWSFVTFYVHSSVIFQVRTLLMVPKWPEFYVESKNDLTFAIWTVLEFLLEKYENFESL